MICGSNTSYLKDEAWVTEKIRLTPVCEVRVSPNTSVIPNLGGIELAEALARVIPYVEKGKEARPVLKCVRFAQKERKLCLTSADGFRLASFAGREMLTVNSISKKQKEKLILKKIRQETSILKLLWLLWQGWRSIR